MNDTNKKDTSDTGRAIEYEDNEIISAAKLAGETGGISCSSLNFININFAIITAFFIIILFKAR